MTQGKLELLAPVGGREHLRAAVQAGADAVYLGGTQFNARINADNFDEAGMQWAVDYAHLRGVKVYVTMNTLLRDEDLASALVYARSLYTLGVDALIVQDWGLAKLVKEDMPDFPLHLSTQGTVYNEAGVRAAKELGFERVVLARELSLSEISACCRDDLPEIEVFVHGALCLCYSGQCNMSRLNGGRSGNRGLCAQPCRLRYDDGEGNVRNFLSPKDLCGLEHLGALIEAGVTSFKIEGRMKSPEYVAVVTGIYRKYMDLYLQEGYYSVSEEDRRALLQAFNRGGFTDGYLTGHIGERMMALDVPKHQGLHIGHVVRKAYQGLVEIELDEGESLCLGDGVEIHNREMSGNVVTYIKPAKDQAGTDGRRLIIGDLNGYFAGGESIYKITEKALNESVRELYRVGKDGSEAGTRVTQIEITVSLFTGKPATLLVSAPVMDNRASIGAVAVHKSFEDIIPELPQKRSLDTERIIEQLSKCGGYPFSVENITVNRDEAMTLPVSALNRMRREVFDRLLVTLAGVYHRDMVSDGEMQLPAALEPDARTILHEFIPGERLGMGTRDNQDTVYCNPIEEALAKGVSSGKAYYISNVSKGRLDALLEERWDELPALQAASGCPIYAGNISWLWRLAKAGIPVIADYGMNITNGASRDAILALGASSYVEALEYRADTFGSQPLMITEQPLTGCKLLQSKQRASRSATPMRLVTSPLGDKTYILD